MFSEQVLGGLLRGATGAALLSPRAIASVMDALHQRLAPICGTESGQLPTRRAEDEGEPADERQCAGALAALRVVDTALGPPAAGPASLAPGGRLVSERVASVLADVFHLAWRADGAADATDADAGSDPGSPVVRDAANDVVYPAEAAPGANGAWCPEPDPAAEPDLAAAASPAGVLAAAACVWGRGARLAGFCAALDPVELHALRLELVRPLAQAVRSLREASTAASMPEVRALEPVPGQCGYDVIEEDIQAALNWPKGMCITCAKRMFCSKRRARRWV